MAYVSDLMTIGTFSRASLLSIKALRNYHSSGLLVPAKIDPETGYRGYHVGQLADAAVIRKLRTLEVSLDDIAIIMAERDPDITAKVLAQHLSTMEERLAATRNIVDELLVGNERPTTLTPPIVIDVEHRYVASIVGTVERASYAEFLGQAFPTLFMTLAKAGVTPSGPGGASYPPRVDDSEQVMAFIPIAEPVDRWLHREGEKQREHQLDQQTSQLSADDQRRPEPDEHPPPEEDRLANPAWHRVLIAILLSHHDFLSPRRADNST